MANNVKSTQVQSKPKDSKSGPCPWLCNLIPTNVPGPGAAQTVLHPGKDVFILKELIAMVLVVRTFLTKYIDDYETVLQFKKPGRVCCVVLLSPGRVGNPRSLILSWRMSLQKVAKVGPNGDRRCKMELELVTPKGPDKSVPSRYDTRDAQCDPEAPPCVCCAKPKKKKKF